MPAKKILIVEDEFIIALDLQNRLIQFGYDVPSLAFTGEEAIELCQHNHFDLVLMDIVLRGNLDGIETAKSIINQYAIPVIFLTAHSDARTLNRTAEVDAFCYIRKPFNDKELKIIIETILGEN
ncbi:response regulator [candidate division KSB1 bacterium]|nr:response regulator [candidate division KSB1 bacterium]